MKHFANKKRKSLAYINIAEYDFAYVFLPVLRNQDICAERYSNTLSAGLVMKHSDCSKEEDFFTTSLPNSHSPTVSQLYVDSVS